MMNLMSGLLGLGGHLGGWRHKGSWFVDLVIPELQERGIFRREYTGKTLRENMGLPMPRNPYFTTPKVAAE